MTQPKSDRKRVVLLATNNSHSIIGEIVDGKSNAIAYSAYGEQSAQQNIETRLGFNGQLREGNIGWYLLGNGYRAYNPRLMRFHSPDSWSPFGGGGLNAYMYCVGDPVNRADPTGHFFLHFAAEAADALRITMPNTAPINRVSFAQRLAGHRSTSVIKSPVSMKDEMSQFVKPFARITTHPKPRRVFEELASPSTGPTTDNQPIKLSHIAYRVGHRSKSKNILFHPSTKQHDGSRSSKPGREHNQLQGGEVLPRKEHWPSNDSISSTGSGWTNASNTTAGSSIHSDRYSHASELRRLEETFARLNVMERDRGWSSAESFHSAASSIRNS